MQIIKRKPIDWVVCAAGRGTRFAEHGLKASKPEILLKGISFLERSLSCLDLLPRDRLIIIIQKKGIGDSLKNRIEKLYCWIDIVWHEIEAQTRGQLETFYLAKEYLGHHSVVIWNCDTFFKSSLLSELLKEDLYDGIVPCGKLDGNQWSFFKTNDKGLVVDVAEKSRIAPWASVGFYYFKNVNEILDLTSRILKDNIKNGLKEFYVSIAYQKMLEKGDKIRNCPVEDFMPFGTVREIENYWNISLNELKRDNAP